jgi:hypothetical protein
MSSTKQTKENTMRATFIRRRIVVAIAFAIMSWGAVNTGQAIIGFLSKPTFACPQTEVTLVKGDKIWNIADKFCDGNITDAAGQIMDDNGIEGKDLDSLQPGTVIVINKKGK